MVGELIQLTQPFVIQLIITYCAFVVHIRVSRGIRARFAPNWSEFGANLQRILCIVITQWFRAQLDTLQLYSQTKGSCGI